jgi:2-keto-4-pentenoate hydratase
MNQFKKLKCTKIILLIFISILIGKKLIFKDVKINYAFQKLTFKLPENRKESIAQKLANNYLEKKSVNHKILQELNLEEAQNRQKEFVSIISKNLGPISGYKAALTNKNTQEKFQVNHPLSGVLLEKMLLPSGSVVSRNFGAKPMLEGDLMVRVKSKEVNKAKTPEEILTYLDAVIPFLELPDLIYEENRNLNGAKLLATNIGARLGIMGEPVLINNSKEWQDKLNNIQVIIQDQDHQEIAKGESSSLLGHPLNVVLWLKNDLNKQGILLKQGDLLSLGSITALIPVKKNTIIKVKYFGLKTKPVEINLKIVKPKS